VDRRLLIGIGLLVTLAGGSVARASPARTFYVSAAGSDRAGGRTPDHAWRTIARVNRARLQPGDTVLFEAGATFSDTTLTPPASGAAGAPIVFASYGPGKATLANAHGAVWFSGLSYVTFRSLVLTTGSSDAVIFAGSDGQSTHITLRDSVLRDSNDAAVNQPNARDSSWLIRNDLIRHVGDSALILAGSNDVVWGNTIKDVGWNSDLDYAKHGIYAKGRGVVIERNVISSFQNSGVSLRYSNARVIANTISSGPTAIAFFHEDDRVGTSFVQGNHISKVTRAAFYYDLGTGENFVVTGNTFEMAGGTTLDIAGKPDSRLTVSGNRFLGSFEYALSAEAIVGSPVFSESKNGFVGAPRFAWGGRSLNFQQYRAQSGQGAGDRVGLAAR
jgi:hypothetical protein